MYKIQCINVNVSPCLQNLHHAHACIQLQDMKGYVVKMGKSYKIILNRNEYEFNRVLKHSILIPTDINSNPPPLPLHARADKLIIQSHKSHKILTLSVLSVICKINTYIYFECSIVVYDQIELRQIKMTRFKREKFDRNLFSRPQVPGTLRACPGL